MSAWVHQETEKPHGVLNKKSLIWRIINYNRPRVIKIGLSKVKRVPENTEMRTDVRTDINPTAARVPKEEAPGLRCSP